MSMQNNHNCNVTIPDQTTYLVPGNAMQTKTYKDQCSLQLLEAGSTDKRAVRDGNDYKT